MNNESALLKKFLLEYSRRGGRLFRFQSGLFWTGKTSGPTKKPITVNLHPGDMVIRRARPVKSGHPGISDTVGWTRIQITPDMVGRTVSVFTAVEAKTENVRATKEQKNFINLVNEHGGIGVIAKKLQDIFDATSNFIKGDANETRH